MFLNYALHGDKTEQSYKFLIVTEVHMYANILAFF